MFNLINQGQPLKAGGRAGLVHSGGSDVKCGGHSCWGLMGCSRHPVTAACPLVPGTPGYVLGSWLQTHCGAAGLCPGSIAGTARK